MGPLVGSIVVDASTLSNVERGAGAVARVNLYGPMGGDLGSALVNRTNAREAISRLTAALERTR